MWYQIEYVNQTQIKYEYNKSLYEVCIPQMSLSRDNEVQFHSVKSIYNQNNNTNNITNTFFAKKYHMWYQFIDTMKQHVNTYDKTLHMRR